MSGAGLPSEGAGLGHGKAILVGEHHVMTGATALAIGLPAFRTEVTLRPVAGPPLSLQWPEAGLIEDVRRDTLAMVTRACQLADVDCALMVSITSTVPIRRGLGSSAALAVAVVRAAHAVMKSLPLMGILIDQAREVECVVHGRSSGLDPAAAASQEGGVLFRDGQVLQQVRASPGLSQARWVLLDLGASAPTRDAIDHANAHRRQLGSAAVQALTDAVTAAAHDAARALQGGDLAALADAMALAGATLEPLGVVDAAMRHVLALAVEAGALAAKQTGAGMGGMLIALAPDAAAAQRIAALTSPHVRSHWLLPVSTSP